MADMLFKPSSLERAYLESLTTRELIRLADSFGIEIPPDLERIFIIAEILDIDADIAAGEFGKEDHEENPLMETTIPEPVPLPKQYNITFIEVLIRDPLWVFTFWEIKSYDKEVHEKAHDFGGYHLKVSPGSAQYKTPKKEDSFTIPVGITDTAWYIGFPPEGGCFKVELCAVRGYEEIALAGSHPFTLPALFNPPNRRNTERAAKADDLYANPLIRLSGVEDFQVIRNGDRQSRNK
ncbi:MAG: DUF4912 domain-containing protein [Treponema sp.]|jgi:hypothetical protein|nr:DUF4912 domain-containing protein [Treponema sp.]